MFEFYPEALLKLQTERQEKELRKRKEEIEQLVDIHREEKDKLYEEKEIERKLLKKEKDQEERKEKERVALELYFGERGEATIENSDALDSVSLTALRYSILRKKNWMNDEHFQRIMTYFIDDMFLHRIQQLVDVAGYMSGFICFVFKKNKADYNPLKHMRVLLTTFLEHDDNEKECISVLNLMGSEMKRLQKMYGTTNASARFEKVVERLGIGHTTDANATFGEKGISHMTLAFILDNKSMIGYLYNHGGKITTVLEYFEVNFLKNNPNLNTPIRRLMVLMYISIEIFEIGIRWTSPINDDDLVAEFDAMKPLSSEKKKKKKNEVHSASVVSSVTSVDVVDTAGNDVDDDDDEDDYTVFAKKSHCPVKPTKKKVKVKEEIKPVAVKTILKRVEKKPTAEPATECSHVKTFVKPIATPTVTPLVKPFAKPIAKPFAKPLVKPVVKVHVDPTTNQAPLSPRAIKLASLLQQQPMPAFLGLQYISMERIYYAIDRVCHLKL